MLADWLLLVEGVAESRGLSEVATKLLMAFARIGPPRLDGYRSWKGDQLEPDDMGNIGLDQVYNPKRPTTFAGLTPKIAAFVRASIERHLIIGFSTHRVWGGWYQTGGAQPLIKIVMSLDDLARVEKTDYRFWTQYHGVLVHELTHAYDDWISEGKYHDNTRSGDARRADKERRRNPDNAEAQKRAGALYMNDPVEINARYIAATAKLDAKPYDRDGRWPTYLAAFRYEFLGWRDLPELDRLRLTKRLAAHWQEQTVTYQADPKRAVDAMREKLQAAGSRVWLSYHTSRSGVVTVENLTKKDPIETILRPILALADTHGLTVCLMDKLDSKQVRPFGFVNQRPRSVNGGKRDYSLPLGTVYFRRPVDRRAKAAQAA